MKDIPVDILLHLNVSKLPEQAFKPFEIKGMTVRRLRERSKEAWWNFGKPGRDPNKLGGVLEQFAQQSHWVPYLKIAQLERHWSEVVGTAIASHSHVVAYDHGVLTIQASSTVWATQLNYLIPQLQGTIEKKLEGLPIERIKVTGPHSYSFRRGKFDIPGRGVRDTYF
ncbi:DUF721 domain-containing protein [Bifidobacterium aquikefiri]|uniref:Zn-ribbon-containing RNA-binding protein n=1 Tax=Bifidobacterium aquikefiri TaxID=1653207 RepID=A0A261GBD2_9BIFI|nr:DciA family protein [Bifidobacterium aquikefiri]OZG68738.1 hypothetical protein BAQU_0037 [Bifidobacterium aquikefiri]